MPSKHHNQAAGMFLGTLLVVGVLFLFGAVVVYFEDEPGRGTVNFAHSR
jgi:hypothetical protein